MRRVGAQAAVAIASLLAATAGLQAQRLASLSAAAVALPNTTVDVALPRRPTTDSTPAQSPGIACNVIRVTALAAGGYVGYAIGGLSELPLAIWNAPPAVARGIEIVGAAAGVLFILDQPMDRRLPFCPASLRTLSGRPVSTTAACRSARFLYFVLGVAGGTLAAGVTALPFALTNSGGHAGQILFIALPAAGGVAGIIGVGRSPPCTS